MPAPFRPRRQDDPTRDLGEWDNTGNIRIPGTLTVAGIAAPASAGAGGAPAGNGLSDWVNVKAAGIGAKGDGVTDDTKALNLALASLGTNGGTVYVPAGTYNISSPLVIQSGTMLVGAGRNASRIVQTSTSSDGIANTATGLTNITIQDLDVRGPGSGTGIGIRLGANTSASDYVALLRLNVQDFGSHNVYLGRLIVSSVINVRSRGAGGHAFYADHGTSLTFIACYGLSAAQDGYYLSNLTYSALVGCASDSCGIGYEVDTCNEISFSGCGAESFLNNSVSYPGYGWKLNAGGRHVFNSCYTFANPNIAFLVTGNSTKNTITAFQEASPTGSPTASIQVDSGSRATIISPSFTTAMVLTGQTNVIDNGSSNMPVGFGVGPTNDTGARVQVNDDGTNGGFLVKSTAIGTASTAPLRVLVSDITKRMMDLRLTGDNVSRVRLDMTAAGYGRLLFGDGTTTETNVYRFAASVLATDGDFRVAGVGKGLQIAGGSNAKIGKATLVAGTVVVSNTSVTANSLILLTGQNSSGTAGAVGVTARTAGTSFTITSTSGTDTRDIGYVIVESV